MKTIHMQTSTLHGPTGTLSRNLTTNWLLGLRRTNPAILDMFADRDKKPYRDLLPWSGEFAGKYITGAYYVYQLTKDPALYQEILAFNKELVSLQDDDGYLGCYSKDCHLTGAFSENPSLVPGTWDAWSHYHILFGLLLWYEETKIPTYLEAIEKAAQLFLHTFYNPKTGNKHLVEIGNTEMNLAPLHLFALLYNKTGNAAYLDFALQIVDDLPHPDAGNYLNHALKGLDFYRCPKPRWESLHVILGFAELYRATGSPKYLQAIDQIYHSIQKTDVHNTGAFSSGEGAIGTPFTSGKIETCCVIAYNALAVEVFKLTGDPTILDFLELSHYNACMGAWSPSGRWSTYDTAMNGSRISSATEIVFQSRPGSPELNCCSVNASRGIGMLSEWAVTEDENTLCINSYECAEYVTESGVSIRIEGHYPAEGTVQIHVEGYSGRLAFRIPSWSANTKVTDGDTIVTPAAGQYLIFDCSMEKDLVIDFDFSTRYLAGELEFEGLYSVYRGPILFGTDVHLLDAVHSVKQLPSIDRTELEQAPSCLIDEHIRIPLERGITLGDFYHLGETGASYVTWLPIIFS